MSSKDDWFGVKVTPEMIERAKGVRAQRKDLGKGRGGVESDANRWIGDLGAIALEDWFWSIGLDVEWQRGRHVYSADFKIGGESIRVRCSKRSSFREDDGIGLNERHRKHAWDTRYVFAVYDGKARINFVGTMLLGEFVAVSEQYETGELIPVGNSWTKLPDGTKLYDVPMTYATPIKDWLCGAILSLDMCASQMAMFP